MAETTFSRSRRAALYGLLLQVIAFAGAMALAHHVQSLGLKYVAWYLLGGVPIWLCAVLVFHQRNLAALESMDLEELRRERKRSGVGEGMFDEGRSELAFRIAEARLAWMQKWLIPGFSLATALYLVVMGGLMWMQIPKLDSALWPVPQDVPLGMIITAILMLFLFLFSRYASGMGRQTEWRLLRGAGSYMLGNALTAMALIVCLGVLLYANAPTWERVLAYVIPVLMVVLGVEIALQFVFNIYRPRSEIIEAHPAFDSRLLGLISEPGGIAHSIAEAINYQFGFQVSQTWFYQLLQRAFVPLVLIAAAALWGLTSIVIVQPGEHTIIEQLGAQIDPQHPLGPGVYLKMPWPFAVARKFETGRIHQIVIGFREYDAEPKGEGHDQIVLWTDPTHFGQQHFNFLIPPKTRADANAPTTQPAGAVEQAQAAPVHIMRMDIVVQYRMDPARLADYTRNVGNPEDTLRNLAWTEVNRFSASTDADTLLGEGRKSLSEKLQNRIAARAAELKLGLNVTYVGIENIHPEKSVAEAYRNVVTADQERIATIRTARVEETKKLGEAAGSRTKALALVDALNRKRAAETDVKSAESLVTGVNSADLQALHQRVAAIKSAIEERLEAERAFDQAALRRRDMEEEALLGMGGKTSERNELSESEKTAAAAQEKARAAEQAALAPIRQEFAPRIAGAALDAAIRLEVSRAALDYWNVRQEQQIVGLEGKASATLAAAQADRWEIELKVEREAARLENEREVFRSVPEIYRYRTFLETLVEILADDRKFVLAYDPKVRKVTLRIVSDDQPTIGLEAPVRAPGTP